ncbi:MAG: preprotein translocase subunit SecA, partial [Candidatus Saccharibacteria bacterium]|nr:preprotein translocase subunit SecA [Candidatus Saccharibacteria bacterium]
REAAIVEKAGQKGAITLATNIAGRGTDIKLGEGVKELGGLVVIGSERHESRRIDNQLRGRGGRQGDPGETQFYVSTEDDLMRIFQGERIAALMDRLGVDEDTPIQNRAVSKTLEAAQKRVEGYHFDTRKSVVQYDNVINRHRRVVYAMRRRILEGDNIKPEIERLLRERITRLVELPLKHNAKFVEELTAALPLTDDEATAIGEEKKDKARLAKALKAATAAYQAKEDEIGADELRGVEREVYMAVLDTLWMQHLENMQHLREGIHWRSVGQRDPLVEYRAESQKLFDSLQENLRNEVLNTMFHIHKTDAVIRQSQDDEYDTELTRLAESAVEKGVNEIGSGEANRDDDFTVKKGKTAADANKVKNAARKKKKAQRQNRKKSRK